MISSPHRFLSGVLALALVFPSSALAFDTPLSDTAVREAYFLGQRHDLHCMDAYTKSLPVPAKGPQIAAVMFLTPFAQVVQQTSAVIKNYSAQQAQADHDSSLEVAQIIVVVRLTPSYGAIISPGDVSRPDVKPVFRPDDFWKEISVTVLDGDQQRQPPELRGHANFACAHGGYPCWLIGATLKLNFPAAAFASDTALITIVPPEGDQVSVKFDLAALR